MQSPSASSNVLFRTACEAGIPLESGSRLQTSRFALWDREAQNALTHGLKVNPPRQPKKRPLSHAAPAPHRSAKPLLTLFHFLSVLHTNGSTEIVLAGPEAGGLAASACTRHHPLHVCRATGTWHSIHLLSRPGGVADLNCARRSLSTSLSSPSASGQVAGWTQTARVIFTRPPRARQDAPLPERAHIPLLSPLGGCGGGASNCARRASTHPPLSETMSLLCALREHRRHPDHTLPFLCARCASTGGHLPPRPLSHVLVCALCEQGPTPTAPPLLLLTS